MLTGPVASAALEEEGRAPRQPLLLETSGPGVMAVGDVRSGSIKRVASAVGEGSMAVRLWPCVWCTIFSNACTSIRTVCLSGGYT